MWHAFRHSHDRPGPAADWADFGSTRNARHVRIWLTNAANALIHPIVVRHDCNIAKRRSLREHRAVEPLLERSKWPDLVRNGVSVRFSPLALAFMAFTRARCDSQVMSKFCFILGAKHAAIDSPVMNARIWISRDYQVVVGIGIPVTVVMQKHGQPRNVDVAAFEDHFFARRRGDELRLNALRGSLCHLESGFSLPAAHCPSILVLIGIGIR